MSELMRHVPVAAFWAVYFGTGLLLCGGGVWALVVSRALPGTLLLAAFLAWLLLTCKRFPKLVLLSRRREFYLSLEALWKPLKLSEKCSLKRFVQIVGWRPKMSVEMLLAKKESPANILCLLKETALFAEALKGHELLQDQKHPFYQETLQLTLNLLAVNMHAFQALLQNSPSELEVSQGIDFVMQITEKNIGGLLEVELDQAACLSLLSKVKAEDANWHICSCVWAKFKDTRLTNSQLIDLLQYPLMVAFVWGMLKERSISPAQRLRAAEQLETACGVLEGWLNTVEGENAQRSLDRHQQDVSQVQRALAEMENGE